MPILMQNAIPVFADVDPLTLNMRPDSIEANITDRTRAIILVHLFGRPCDIDPVVRIAQKHDLILNIQITATQSTACLNREHDEQLQPCDTYLGLAYRMW